MEAEYRKMVGKLLWTVKKESPYCANVVSELSAHPSNPGQQHWDAVRRFIGFLSEKKDNVLKMHTPTSILLDEITADFVDTPPPQHHHERGQYGAIFTAKNQQMVGVRTKHIDVKYHHVKDMLDAEELMLPFVRSEHSFADLMIKKIFARPSATGYQFPG